MKKFLTYLNDQHWYLIAIVVACVFLLWIYGCQSQVRSMIDPTKMVSREELQVEADYLIGQIKNKMSDLDRQDELKMLMLEQATIFGQSGTFNPTGLMNTIVTIGAIAFGLDRNRKYKVALLKPVVESPPVA